MPNSVRPYLTNGGSISSITAGLSDIQVPHSPEVLDKSWTLTADIDVPAERVEGMIVTQGDSFGGTGQRRAILRPLIPRRLT